MANKSSTPTQVIALPQGGGALSGIGEKFSPDLHTGTGNFTIPIGLPSGRNGFNPQLNLRYSTGNGNQQPASLKVRVAFAFKAFKTCQARQLAETTV